MAGRVGRAVFSSIWGLIFYIIVPIGIFSILSSFLPEEISIGDIKQKQMLLLVFGLVIVISIFFKSYFIEGSILRLIFGLVMISFICLWIFVVMGGGYYDIALEDSSFHINFSKLMLLIVFVTALKGIYLVVEFIVMRKKLTEKKGSNQLKLQSSQTYQTPSAQYQQNFQTSSQFQPKNLSNNQKYLHETIKNKKYQKVIVTKKVVKKTTNDDEWLE